MAAPVASSRSSWAAAALAPWCAFLKQHASVALRPKGDALLIYVRLRAEAPGSLPNERIARCREAMALLGAVAAVDNDEWQLLLEHECVCSNLPLVDPGTLGPCFELRLGDSKDDALGFDTQFYREFFILGDQQQHVSGEFTEAMEIITNRAQMLQTRTGDFINMGRYLLHLRFIPRRSIESELVASYLQSVLNIVREIRRREKTHVGQSPFVLAEASVHIDRLELPAGASTVLAELVDRDDESGGVLMYPSFEIGGNATIGRLPTDELAQVLQGLTSFGGLASSEDNKQNDSEPAGGNRVHINNFHEHLSKSASSKYLHNVRALCSAAGASQKIDELHLENIAFGAKTQKKSECWQWLAYALFSKDATSRISKLTIEDNYFRGDDMESIMCCLRSKNPAAKLWRVGREGQLGAEADDGDENSGGDEYDDEEQEKLDDHQIFGVRAIYSLEEDYGELDFRGSEDGVDDEDPDDACDDGSDEWEDDRGEKDPTSVCLKAGATVEICTSNRQLSERTALPSSYTNRQFRVMNYDESLDAVDIIVPCYGHCRVSRESITQSVNDTTAIAQSSSLSLGYNGSITEIYFDFQRATDGNALLPLIEYLGPRLTSLNMQSEVGVNTACFCRIMSACPKLESLAICNMLNVVELELPAAYEEKRCRISDLTIADFAPSENTTNLIRLLCDPTSEVAQHLRHLKLIPDSLRSFEASTLTAVLEMLQVNNVLESLQLRLSPALYCEFAPRLLKFHKQSLFVVKAPLPRSSRLAFLSAMRAVSNPSLSSSSGMGTPVHKKARLTTGVDLQRLDSDVISLILHFAAERPIREIVVRSL
ncbi:hypothetical protein Gpo141_00010942 [Globisporangium polare]